jgi:hypothetical protein
MTLYDNIKKFEGCFFGIRKHEDYFILDLTIPNHWTYEGLVDKEKVATKVNKTTSGHMLVSFYCLDTRDGVKYLEDEVVRVLKINKDEEEKNRLLQEKQKELEMLFQSKKLDELKSMNFNIPTTEPFKPKFDKIIENGKTKQGIPVTESTTEKGREGDK